MPLGLYTLNYSIFYVVLFPPVRRIKVLFGHSVAPLAGELMYNLLICIQRLIFSYP